jgi:Na+/proline symporter
LTRKKKFSWIWFIIWLLLAVVGGFFYLIYYATKKGESMMIQIGLTGKVTRTRS